MTSFEDRIKIVVGSMSGRKLASKLGKSSSTVNQYLTGIRKPSIEFVVLICGRLQINPWWLMTGEGEMRSQQPGIVSEKPEGFEPIQMDADRRRGVLFHRLQRIMDEGDKAKIEAVKAQLKAFDPGEKKQSMDCAENEGAGTKNNQAA